MTIAVAVLLLLRILHWFFTDKWRWWLWLLPPALAVSAFALDFLVATDSEKIRSTVRVGVEAVEQENPAAMERIIADDYSDSFHSDKTALMNNFRLIVSEPFVENGTAKITSLKVDGVRATVGFSVWIKFDKDSEIYRTYKPQTLVKMQLGMRKTSDRRWLITWAEILEVDLQPVRWSDIQI